jgi:uncharacterized membrane protein YebE (DUF533 family)
MSFGNILGQFLEQGVPGQRSTQSRIDTSANNLSRSGGLNDILGQIQGALGGTAGGSTGRTGSMAGLAEAAKGFLRKEQAGGMTGAQLGGIGAVAGALFGGGVKGAARGGALAILGTLALSAVRKSQTAKTGSTAGAPQIDHGDLAAVTSPESERLALRAMIAAAKADGEIDQAEMDRILGKVADDEVTPEERRFVLDEIRKPLDPADLAREVASPAQAAEVYAASLLAIDVDSEAERAYLRRLAEALKLDEAAVAYLHETTGAPRA